jgi:(p)ppGpp synthase/HD superfamily hydrolase
VWFPTQIIVTSELNKKNHLWLSALTMNLQMQDLRALLEASEKLNGKYDKALVESVLQVSVTANEDLIKKVGGEKRMCEALMEILEPEIRAREEKAVAEAEATAEKRMQEMKKAFRLIQGGCDTVESLVEKGISRSVAEDVLGD